MSHLEALIRASCDETHIEAQARRIEHLERAILEHRAKVTMKGCLRGRHVDRALWSALGNAWEVDDD